MERGTEKSMSHAKHAKIAKKAWKKGLSLAILALPVRVWSQADLERAIASGREESLERGTRKGRLIWG